MVEIELLKVFVEGFIDSIRSQSASMVFVLSLPTLGQHQYTVAGIML